VKEKIPFRVAPMLATLVEEPFTREGWVFEEKYDGYRILAYKEGKTVTLLSRNAKDRTESFADVAKAVSTLPDTTLLLDGEAVAFDKSLISRFQLLQQGRVPVVYAVFDCLYRSGRDLRELPLSQRREEMEEAIGETLRLIPSRRLGSDGRKAYREAKRRGFEGVVGKDASSPYVEGRTLRWLKVKAKQEEELVIGGYTAPGGTRSHFGSILVGGYRRGKLLYAGRVGTGFNEKTLTDLKRRFRKIERADSPFADLPKEKDATWLEPRLVAQIAFQEWTEEGRLRQPVYLGLRDDKAASEVKLPGGRA
jgi:bifunctional non-homologous end joining protein LigD